MENITFETLPKAVSAIFDELASIKKLIQSKDSAMNLPQENAWLTVDQLRVYLPSKPAKATVYGWVCHKEIPFHKHGKKLFFSKSEIDQWLAEGKRLTRAEISRQADQFLRKEG